MNDTGYVALTDTTRDELRDRIDLARNRFDQLVRVADPQARPPGSRWTVQQVVAHVLTIANRYHEVAQGGMYRPADTPDGVAALNQAELEAALGPVPDLADRLRALAADIDGYFDTLTDDCPTIPFHGGGFIGGFTAQTNWLGELLLHGQDMRGARPYLMHIHHGTAEIRERRLDDRPDAVLRTPASTLAQLLYQRIGPFTATLRGLRIVGGRRPWLALKLQSYFLPAWKAASDDERDLPAVSPGDATDWPLPLVRGVHETHWHADRPGFDPREPGPPVDKWPPAADHAAHDARA